MSSASNLELIVRHPSGGALVRDYLEGREPASSFFARPFDSLASFEEQARHLDERFDRGARERAVEAVMVPPGGDPERLRRFVEEGGYMVTTGQQPGLFGGPLYNLSKALTAVRLAEALEERLGKPVLPLFWVSSEDHDWEEAGQANVVGVDNELHRIHVGPPDPSVMPSIHRVPLRNGSAEAVTEFLGYLPSTEFSDEYFALLRQAFAPGRTIAEGFHATLHHLLGRFGMVFTDGVHPAVKRDSGELLLEELERSEELEQVLARTATELQEAGYDIQVPILEGGVNLFLEGPAGRERLYRQDGGYRLRSSGLQLSAADVRARFADDPAVLSPNVLMRPVVESALFPTLAYVGGPGEMAYWGQLRDYFAAHGLSMPVVYPRWAATPVEAKVRKVLDKFHLDVTALDRPFHEIASDLAREEMPAEVREVLDGMRDALASRVPDLERAATNVDPTLARPVQQAVGHARASLDDLERKVLQAVKRKSEVALNQLEKAKVHLYPLGKPAERVQSPFYYLTRYGGALLDDLYERFPVNLG